MRPPASLPLATIPSAPACCAATASSTLTASTRTSSSSRCSPDTSPRSSETERLGRVRITRVSWGGRAVASSGSQISRREASSLTPTGTSTSDRSSERTCWKPSASRTSSRSTKPHAPARTASQASGMFAAPPGAMTIQVKSDSNTITRTSWSTRWDWCRSHRQGSEDWPPNPASPNGPQSEFISKHVGSQVRAPIAAQTQRISPAPNPPDPPVLVSRPHEERPVGGNRVSESR
jgi:hypothetical protein